MNLRGMFFGLTGAVLLLGGCGEVAFKTGAGADALKADQLTCRQTSAGPAAYKACMNDKGWAIAELDGGPSSTYIPPMATQPGVPSAATTGASAPMSPAETPWMKPPAAATPAAQPTDPMTAVPVTAWFKFGGNNPKDAIASCVATLGPAHQPDTLHKTVTVALLSCMRDHGWRGV